MRLRVAEGFYRSGELWCWNTKLKTSDFLPERFEVLVRQFDSSTNCLRGSWCLVLATCEVFYMETKHYQEGYILPFWHFHNVFLSLYEWKIYAIEFSEFRSQVWKYTAVLALCHDKFSRKKISVTVFTILKNSKSIYNQNVILFNSTFTVNAFHNIGKNLRSHIRRLLQWIVPYEFSI